jgi:hypothetical protein
MITDMAGLPDFCLTSAYLAGYLPAVTAMIRQNRGNVRSAGDGYRRHV